MCTRACVHTCVHNMFCSHFWLKPVHVLGTIYKSQEVFWIQSHPDEKRKEKKTKTKNKRCEKSTI